MDIHHLKAELRHHQMQWNQLGSDFDQTEAQIRYYMHSGEKETMLLYFAILKEIESKMRPLRNNLIFLYENLAQSSGEKGNHFAEQDFYQKARDFQKKRYKRSNRSMELNQLLKSNGMAL